MNTSFIRIEVKNDLRIVYFRSDGSSAVYLGGKRAWRNNNPGNLAYGNSKLMKRLGAIGKAGGFAVFPNYETGRNAIFAVLKQKEFQERTLSKAIEVWAPAEHGNDSALYKQRVKDWTTLDLNRMLKNLSEAELELFVNAIERMEGKGDGKIIEIPSGKSFNKKQITKVRKDKKGIIVAYFIEEIGWVSKSLGIELAANGDVDAVVAISSNGNSFLRTRPGIEIVNLEEMG